MWIRLNKREISLILKSIPKGKLATILKASPHPNTKAYADAVPTNDELEVDSDTLISPGENGAYVMSWVWIYDYQAGLNNDSKDDDL